VLFVTFPSNFSKELREKMGRLVGDVLSAASFLSYAGPFNQEYRSVLSKQWNEIVQQYDIPRTTNFSVLSLMADSSEVSEWTLQGLPNDELSIENAVIVTSGACYPLLVDPQSQGKSWVKNKEVQNNLLVHKNLNF
jgi:dynein heavy chain